MITKTRKTPGIQSSWGPVWGGGSETIETEGHDLRDLGRRDCGGPMKLDRSLDIHTPGLARYGGATSGGSKAFVSYLGNSPINSIWSSSGLPSDASILAKGTTAIARTTPTNPSFDLSNAVGEFMIDGLPSVLGVSAWRERTKLARAAGSEYINYEFGWLPLVNDIRNFSRTVKNHEKLMSHFYEGSGKNIKRRYDFPASFSSIDLKATAGTWDMMLQWGTSPSFLNTGTQSGLLYRSDEQWFSGCYTYYAIPPKVGHGAMDSIRKYAAYADHLLGVRLTPETVWNLAPWSWAVDWFTNTGDIIHNISAFSRDSLVLKYGYIMSFSRMRGNAYKSAGTTGGWSVSAGSVSYLRERKTRFRANPYLGFGTTGSLSDSQKAILLALGLSRAGF